MSEIKPVERFTCGNGGAAFCQGCYEMTEDEDGHYVEFAAYEALKAESAAQAKRIAELESKAAKDHVTILRLKDALSAYGDPDIFADDED